MAIALEYVSSPDWDATADTIGAALIKNSRDDKKNAFWERHRGKMGQVKIDQ